MDADDISFEDRFEKQISFLILNPDIDIVGGAIIEFSDELSNRRLVKYPETIEMARAEIAFRSPFAHPTICFRRTVFDEISQYPEVVGNEDIALWFDCMKKRFKFANFQDPILYFCVSDGFLARSGLGKSISELRCYLSGLYSIEGLSIRMIFPFLRFIFQIMPRPIRKYGYFLRSDSKA